jgi:RNA polymerase sigma-70 factor, ECF subfamily
MGFDEKRSTGSCSDKGRERDEELKALLASDLSTYFELLMLVYAQKLIAFTVSLSGNLPYTEDIVQESFIKAYYALERSSSEKILSMNIRAWLYKITYNTYVNYITRYDKFSPVSTDLPEEREYLEITENGHYPPPDKEVEQKETYNELYFCINRLPDKLRLPVLLHYIFELEYQEVAEVLQQPFNTVKSNGLRGFRKLRDMMREERLKIYGA